MILCFINNGEIDITAATTLGVNVKPDGNPIGEFGTGLKYAIAGILRLGGSIRIWSGENLFSFTAYPTEIRGKSFDIVHMILCDSGGTVRHQSSLSFTTALGIHWKPWMIYRELRSNMLDEGGEITAEKISWEEIAYNYVQPNRTIIAVECLDILAAHHNAADYFLESQPLWVGEGVEIHPASAGSIYYRGMLVAFGKGHLYSYNLTGKWQLTEDRSLANEYEARAAISKAILACTSEEVLQKVLWWEPSEDGPKQDDLFEANLDFCWYSHKPGQLFWDTAYQRIKAKKGYLNDTVSGAMDYRDAKKRKEAEEAIAVPDDWEAMQRLAPKDAKFIRAESNSWELQKELETAINTANYWKNCAMALADRLGQTELAHLQEMANEDAEIGGVE